MVATRRGVRVVQSTSKPDQNESSNASDNVILTRRSRRVAVHVEAQPSPGNLSDGQNPETSAPSSPGEDKTTQEEAACVENQSEDIHDADVSDLESCCSVVSSASAVRIPSRRSTRKKGRPTAASTNPTTPMEGLSEAESCVSAVSATPSTASRRSARNLKNKDAEGASGDCQLSEAESCSSVMSLRSRVLARTQKKASGDSPASHTEDTEVSKSTVRRSTRSRKSKAVEPVPFDLDDNEDASSVSSAPRKTPSRRAKTNAATDSATDCKTSRAPSTQRSVRSRAKDAVTRATSDSESDVTGYSSSTSRGTSVLGQGTPCSSRTGSASSNRAVPVSRTTRALRSGVAQALSPNREDGDVEEAGEHIPTSGAVDTEEKMDVQDKPEKKVIVTSGDEETEKGGEDVTLTAVTEEAEEVEVQEPETREDDESSLLADVGEEDKTVVAVEEEEQEDADIRDVTVLEAAQPELQEYAHAVCPTVTVSEAECSDAVEAADMIPAAHGQSETEPSKDGAIVFGGVEEIPDSSTGNSSNLETPCADRVTVHEVAEADTTKEVVEGNDKLLIAADLCSDHTVKVSEPSDSVAELDDNEAGAAEPHVGPEVDQTVKVTIRDSSSAAASLDSDMSVGPDASSSDVVTKEETQHDGEDQPMELNEDPEDTPSSSSALPEVSAPDDIPSGSKASQKVPAVSLLDSSDEDEDSDACSFAEDGHGDAGSARDSEEVSESEEALTTTHKTRAKGLPSDGLFVIDTQPGLDPSRQFYSEERAERVSKRQEGDEITGMVLGKGEDEEEFVDEEVDEEEDEDAQVLFSSRRNPALKELSCRIDPGLKVKELGGLYINFDGSKSNKVSSSLKKLKEQKHLDELMKKSVIAPDIEKKDSIPPYKESMNALKLKRRAEREKTTGDGWFNMKAPEMTEELKNDLKALKMRSAMDPKRFYKKNDREGFAKYVQVGTVVDSPLDFYHSRIPKKERKRTIVEELLADAEFRSKNKRKYQEILTERAALLAGKKHRKNKFKSKESMKK